VLNTTVNQNDHPPSSVDAVDAGGYLAQDTNLLRFRSLSLLSVLSRANLSSIQNSLHLNYLGSIYIPWKINQPVLDVLKELSLHYSDWGRDDF